MSLTQVHEELCRSYDSEGYWFDRCFFSLFLRHVGRTVFSSSISYIHQLN